MFWFRKRKGLRGSLRIHADLVGHGWKASVNTVAASMREQGLVARPKRKRRGLTKTDRNARKAPDAPTGTSPRRSNRISGGSGI